MAANATNIDLITAHHSRRAVWIRTLKWTKSASLYFLKSFHFLKCSLLKVFTSWSLDFLIFFTSNHYLFLMSRISTDSERSSDSSDEHDSDVNFIASDSDSDSSRSSDSSARSKESEQSLLSSSQRRPTIILEIHLSFLLFCWWMFAGL